MVNSTIVSMTDATGKTGNADYKYGKYPTDEELVEAAGRYGLHTDIKFTITDIMGVKTKFKADIVDGKLVRTSKVDQNLYALRCLAESIYGQEIEKLTPYMEMDFSMDFYLEKFDIRKEDVWSVVEQRRQGVWGKLPEKYLPAMFNYVFTEQVSDKVGNVAI